MNVVASRVGVDAGMIIVCDADYFKSFDADYPNKLARTIKVPKGKYAVSWAIPNTWNGNIAGDEGLEITSGKMVVVDPCYILQDAGKKQEQWMKWLNDTDYGKDLKANNAFTISSMGGDGRYEVRLSLSKVK